MSINPNESIEFQNTLALTALDELKRHTNDSGLKNNPELKERLTKAINDADEQINQGKPLNESLRAELFELSKSIAPNE